MKIPIEVELFCSDCGGRLFVKEQELTVGIRHTTNIADQKYLHVLIKLKPCPLCKFLKEE